MADRTMKEILAAAKDRVERVLATGGNLFDHLRTVLAVTPEIAQLDFMTFEATIAAAGTVSAQPGTNRVPQGYDFDVFGLTGYVSAPATNPENIALITFNIQELGKKRNMFSTDVNMASLITTTGPSRSIDWRERGIYLAREAADLKATFSIASGWTSGAKTAGCCLIGCYVKR